MKAPLLSVGPETTGDDEHVIASGYQNWFLLALLCAVPITVAIFADTKWVVAAGSAAILIITHAFDGRLHDICIRLRRTNLLLRDLNTTGETGSSVML